ncbi:MAG: hypothetical protein ILP14_07710 [Oscillospiraceae bacterium]|nr:hypothetical protein [Oscillospiraceae bacterium]
MEEQLREQLLEDEQLLWTGCPESFNTFDKTNKPSIVFGLVIKALFILGILFMFLYSAQNGGSKQPGIFICIIAFAVFTVLNPFLIARRLRKKTIYGLTNKRIIRSGSTDNAVPYERIKKATLDTDKDGHTTLLCGERAVDLKPRKWRGEADASFIDTHDAPEADRVILYALPMDGKLNDLLYKYLPIK